MLLYTQLGYWYSQNIFITVTRSLDPVGLTSSHENSWERQVHTTNKERKNSTVPWYIACVLFLASIHFIFELWSQICNFLIKNNLCAVSFLWIDLKIIMRPSLNHHFDKISRLNFWSLSLVMLPRLQAILENLLWICLKVFYILIKVYPIWTLVHITVTLMLYRKTISPSGSYLTLAF